MVTEMFQRSIRSVIRTEPEWRDCLSHLESVGTAPEEISCRSNMNPPAYMLAA